MAKDFICNIERIDPETIDEYKAVMSRMKTLGHANDGLQNIIVYLEREIKDYRKQIVELKNDLCEYREIVKDLRNQLRDAETKDCTQSELEVERIAVGDGLFHIGEEDILILKTECILSKDDITKKQEEICKRTGIKVALLDGRTDIVGVVEHGA